MDLKVYDMIFPFMRPLATPKHHRPN